MDKINQLFIETLKKAEQEGKKEYVFAAIWSLMKEIRGYHDKGFMEKILFQIARKKLDFLMVAKSRKEVNEILRPSLPVYNGNTFLPNGPFHVEEEELVIWSIVSIKVPLNHEGFLRYHQLFKVMITPAIGTMTFSERLRIMLNMPAFHPAGVVPTCVAISPTSVFTLSNKPERFDNIPSVKMPRNQSSIICHIKS